MFGLGHILVVEDNADLRGALAMRLESEGHLVIEAADGRLALETGSTDFSGRFETSTARQPSREPCMSESSGGRERTDESLRAERGKTDSELERKHASVEHSADAVVQRARLAADRVLKTARDVADGETDRPDSSVVEERSRADGVIADQRSTADDDIRHEREVRKRALANLLRLEREETDQHLLTERGFSDQALNTRDIFLAMVSHDLRTLLGGIAMNAEMLAREAGPGDANPVVLPRAATIQRLTARMNRLIGDLVDVASIEAGK